MSTTKRKSRRIPRPSPNGDAPHVEADATVHSKSGSTPSRHRRGTRQPERVKRLEAVAAIRRLVAEAGSHGPRRPMTALARSIAAGMKADEVTKPGGPLEAVVDAAEACDTAAARSAASEAAAWALAWAARSKHSTVASGAAFQRIVAAADAMLPDMEQGDTVAAGFLLVLGRLFADVDACGRYESLAIAAIERDIDALVASDGAITGTGAHAMLEAVSRWAGADVRAEATGGPPWASHTRDALLSAIETAMRLLPSVRRGRGPRGTPAAWAAILDVAARHGVKPAPSRAARGLAVIRSGWKRRDTRILVDARGPAMHLEVVVGSRPIFCGEWSFDARADGVALEPVGGWADSCFESEAARGSRGETTFAEWTLPLSRGLRLERHIVLSSPDRVLVVADAIVPEADSYRSAPADARPLAMEVECRSCLPICLGIEFEAADETRELIGFDESVRVLAMPLAFPEWSSAPCDGRLDAEPGRLVLTRRSKVARLYAPVWIDLDPSRIGERLTWRRLTVADSRQNLPEHRACGYRVQIGGSQWLVYRALDAVRNRSVLGCNLSCEFLLGRIGRTGVVERLIEIQ